MNDWADKIAADFVSEAKSQPVWQEELAAALRKAKADGMREIADMMDGDPGQGEGFVMMLHGMAEIIRTRAARVEQPR